MPNNSSVSYSHFADVSVPRSVVIKTSRHITTGNVGALIPIYVDEVLPGTTLAMNCSKIARLQTLLKPVMDSAELTVSWFFVPNRLLWTHWEEFCGENKTSAWVQPIEYSIPKISSPEGGWQKGSIADYMGIPIGVDFTPGGSGDEQNFDHFPSALPFRGYAMICDRYFRDQNVTDPLNIPLGDAMQTGSNGSDYINDVANGGMPFLVAKTHDRFTSCLPQPQKGSPVEVSLGGFPGGSYPVYTYTPGTPIYTADNFQPMSFEAYKYDGSKYVAAGPVAGTNPGYFDTPVLSSGTGGQYVNYRRQDAYAPESGQFYTAPNNLAVTIPPVQAAVVSVNALRQLFCAQQVLERMATGGTRYGELLKTFFGVTNPDSRLQDPEFLGSQTVELNFTQVNATASTEGNKLADVAGQSMTVAVNGDFVKSFSEYGYVYGLAYVRITEHTYQQGLSRMWTRTRFLDFYNRFFANIGEMPVLSDELFCDGQPPHVFGYNEAWSEYRHASSRTSGEMRSQYAQSLDSWHFGDDYAECPVLSDGWIREDKSNVDRTLAVTSQLADQLLFDFGFSVKATLPMPLYSIPGLDFM